VKETAGLRRIAPLFAVVLISVTACSATSDADTTSTSNLSQQTSPSTVPPASTTPTETPEPTTNTSDTSTTSLLGSPIDFGPQSGDVLAVVGVSHDDTLNLRAGPGPSQQVLATIDPTYAALIAQGETWDTSEAFWIKVAYEGILGWVHFGFVAYLGYTDDVTARVVADLDDYPVAATMEELGLLISEVFESRDPPSRIVMTVEPMLGDLGEVTYDVIGLGDDAEYGVRLHVFGETTAEGFALKTVELTSLCGRGVGDDELCV
jgi:uncharacterized protein YraI